MLATRSGGRLDGLFLLMLFVVVAVVLFWLLGGIADTLSESGYFSSYIASNEAANSGLVADIALPHKAIELGWHATDQHGTDAELIRNACGPYGDNAIKAWLETDKLTVHLLCHVSKDGKSLVGDWVVLLVKNGKLIVKIVEKTAFIPKDGSLSWVEKWLMDKSATPVRITR